MGTQPELMLPIVYSLSSLIHPFEIQYCLPLIKSDPEQYLEESALMIVYEYLIVYQSLGLVHGHI